MWLLLYAIYAWTCGGCMTIQSGQSAQLINARGQITEERKLTSQLEISGSELTELSSPHFGALVITFNNPTAHWQRITNMRIGFASHALNAQVIITAGEDVSAWATATQTRNWVRQQNTLTALALLGAAGSVTQSGLQGRQARGAGGVVRSAALTALGLAALDTKARAVEVDAAFAEGHLLQGPIAVPPGLFAKRWIVLNTPGDVRECLSGLTLAYTFEDGRSERVWLDLREGRMQSEWQDAACSHLRGAGGYLAP